MLCFYRIRRGHQRIDVYMTKNNNDNHVEVCAVLVWFLFLFFFYFSNAWDERWFSNHKMYIGSKCCFKIVPNLFNSGWRLPRWESPSDTLQLSCTLLKHIIAKMSQVKPRRAPSVSQQFWCLKFSKISRRIHPTPTRCLLKSFH